LNTVEDDFLIISFTFTGQRNLSSTLYGFDALAINDTFFVVIVSTDRGLYAIPIVSGVISQNLLPIITSNSNQTYVRCKKGTEKNQPS
jgi:hypothetical protein